MNLNLCVCKDSQLAKQPRLRINLPKSVAVRVMFWRIVAVHSTKIQKAAVIPYVLEKPQVMIRSLRHRLCTGGNIVFIIEHVEFYFEGKYGTDQALFDPHM